MGGFKNLSDMRIPVLSTLVPALVYAAGLLSGCGTRSVEPLIEGVPDDAVAVKVVDLASLLKEAGCEVAVSDGITSPCASMVVSLVAEPDFRDIFTGILSTGKCADLSKVIMFTTSAGHEILTFRLRDEEAFCRIMGCKPEKAVIGEGKNKRDFRRAEVGGMALVMDNGRCWVASRFDDIKGALEGAYRSHFGELEGVREFLDAPGAARLAVNCGRSSLSFLGGGSRWLCIGFNVTEASVSAGAVVMDRDGKLDSIGKRFGEIDTDFLRYTPNDAAVVLAFGKYDGNVRGLSMLFGRFAPVYLSQADGTTSLYAVPAGGVEAVASAAPGSWNVETMVHVPEDVMREGLRQYKERAGGKARDIGNQWTYSEGDNNYYFGAFDGCLVFSSNREISSAYTNSFNEDFSGRRAAMIVDVASGSVLAKAWRLPFGLSFRLGVDDTRVKARITFNGSHENALRSLLKLPQLPDLKERFRANTAR